MSTIMFITQDGVGHVNESLGLANYLQSSGHRIVFVTGKSVESLVKTYGFISEFLLDLVDDQTNIDTSTRRLNFLLNSGIFTHQESTYECWKSLMCKSRTIRLNSKNLLYKEKQLDSLIRKYNPDLFVIDRYLLPPLVYYSQKPWIRIVLTAPFFYDDHFESIPPGGSGYPTNGDQSEWNKFRISRAEFFEIPEQTFETLGYRPYNNKHVVCHDYALSVYAHPEELSYHDIVTYPSNWVNVETFMNLDQNVQQKLPQWLQSAIRSLESGQKLIYLSLGSVVSVDIILMKRLTQILSNTKHRYIISKGPRHQEYNLGENMYGDRYVPQLAILPHVDLVICHGGNNTVTKSLAHGKPLIVMPCLGDQFDNARRIEEVGLGHMLMPYKFTDTELMNAIEVLLNDQNLRNRLESMSKRILNKHRFLPVSQRIEAILKQNK